MAENAQVGIYVNDALESKMTYYLQYDADAIARSCSGYAQEVAGSIRLTNAVPDGLDLPAVGLGHLLRRLGSSRRSNPVNSGSRSM